MNIPFCDFCIDNYGGQYSFLDTNFGKVIRIEVDGDVFKVNLTDRTRFGCYILWHRDSGHRLDGTWGFHKQMECKNLRFALYSAWTHKFLKSLGIKYNRKDYLRFVQDYDKAIRMPG